MTIEFSRNRVVDVARTWLGTPYHHRGRVKGAGTDCAMILLEVFVEAGIIENFEPSDYPSDWMMHRSEEKYLATVERFAKKIDHEPLPGDVILFKFGRCISHGGIVTNWPNIIHAYKAAGIVVEDNVLTSEILKSRIAGVWSVWQ